MHKRTKAQQRALLTLYGRWEFKPFSFLHFRRTSVYSDLMGCILVPWCGMVVGIEDDGYTHS